MIYASHINLLTNRGLYKKIIVKMSLGMKKSIIFVIDSLHCAGAEKSLITFLSTLDFNKFEVDLQLFQYGGILEQFIPKEVNVLPMFPYTKFLKKSIVKQILSFDFKKNIRF